MEKEKKREKQRKSNGMRRSDIKKKKGEREK